MHKLPTKAQANLAIDLVKAIAEGRQIQEQVSTGEFELFSTTTENSTFEEILKLIVEGKKLRIKPLPKLVPWTYAQWAQKFIDPSFYVSYKNDSTRRIKIVSITSNYITPYGCTPYSFSYMLSTFVGPNKEPLGTYYDTEI